MRIFFLFLITFILALFQATFNLPNILIVWFLFLFDWQNLSLIFGLGFFGGIILDLGRGGILGTSSLGFLILIFLYFWYSQYLGKRKNFWLVIFLLFANIIWEKIFLDSFNFFHSLILAILTIFLIKILSYLKFSPRKKFYS
ncbi:MAG: hypothetical protein ACPLKP_03910 [Microgenomates group bacterium]